MTALAAATVQPLATATAASLRVGQRHQRTRSQGGERAGLQTGQARQRRARGAGRLLLMGGDLMPAPSAPDPWRQALGYRMEPDVAEHLVADGLDPDFLGDIAGFSGLDSRDVLDFAGIDRTTVSRRKASGSALPQDAAVKALQITDLLTQATEVFGSPAQASTWLTRPHPSLDGETPLKRARTPWGMSKVQSILVALRYGAAA